MPIMDEILHGSLIRTCSCETQEPSPSETKERKSRTFPLGFFNLRKSQSLNLQTHSKKVKKSNWITKLNCTKNDDIDASEIKATPSDCHCAYKQTDKPKMNTNPIIKKLPRTNRRIDEESDFVEFTPFAALSTPYDVILPPVQLPSQTPLEKVEVAKKEVDLTAIEEVDETTAEVVDASVIEEVSAVAVEDVTVAVIEDVEAAVVRKVEAIVVEEVEAVTVEDVVAAVVEDVGAVVVEDVGAAVVEDVGAAVVEDVGAAVVEDVGAAVVEDVGAVVMEDVETTVVKIVEATLVEEIEAVAEADIEAAIVEKVVEDIRAAVVEDVGATAVEEVVAAATIEKVEGTTVEVEAVAAVVEEEAAAAAIVEEIVPPAPGSAAAILAALTGPVPVSGDIYNGSVYSNSSGNIVITAPLADLNWLRPFHEDCDEAARLQRAREIEQGVEAPPNYKPTRHVQLLCSGPDPDSGQGARRVQMVYSAELTVDNLRAFFQNKGTIRSCPLDTITGCHTQVDFIHYLVPDLQNITNCSFYWGKMDRYEAERLLDGKPEGTFLLRDSAQEEFLFSVSFRKYNRSLHARIEQWNHKFSFDSHDPGVFTSDTVCGLIEHYKDPSSCMFFEPMLTWPLHRNFTFSLQHMCRAAIVSKLTYDDIGILQLPKQLKAYLKEYHYQQKVRVERFEDDIHWIDLRGAP